MSAESGHTQAATRRAACTAWLGGGLAVIALAGCGGTAAAPTAQAPLKASRIFAQSKPAVVLVVSDIKADVTVPAPTITAEKQQALAQLVTAAVTQGRIPDTQQAADQLIAQAILGDPLTYLSPGDTQRTLSLETISQGSGFVITPQGDIVTNAHVAAPKDDDIRQHMALSAVQAFVDDDIKTTFKSPDGSAPGADVVAAFKRADTAFVAKYVAVGKLSKAIFTASGAAVSAASATASGTPAELVTAGEEFPGKDVAVIKTEQRDLPTVPLGDEAGLQTGDSLYVIGYPAAATFNDNLSKQSQSEPTLTSGVLSATKAAAGGSSVLQTDAAFSPGSSGGPVFDSKGDVVGIATASATDQGQAVAGENFVVGASVIRELLDRGHVTPRQGQVSQLLAQALDDIDAEHYSAALTVLRQVEALSPGITVVTAEMATSQREISSGRDKPVDQASGLPTTTLAAAGMAGVITLLALCALAALVLRRRERPAASAPGQGFTWAPSATSGDGLTWTAAPPEAAPLHWTPAR